MASQRRVYCTFCEQTYLTSKFDSCSLCRKPGGLVDAASRAALSETFPTERKEYEASITSVAPLVSRQMSPREEEQQETSITSVPLPTSSDAAPKEREQHDSWLPSATWEADVGVFLGFLKVNGKRSVALTKPATLTRWEDGALSFASRYDPPGSGWLALLATIATAVVVLTVELTGGFMVGPGWLLWYLIFLLARRQNVKVPLAGAEAAVIDVASGRMAFRVEFAGKMRWLAFGLKQRFAEACEAVRTLMSSRCTEGTIKRSYG